MNKLLFFLFTISALLRAQIIVPAQTIVDQVWDVTSTTYVVTGDLRIESLTIGPGVVVQFRGDYDFRVEGYLIALGTLSDSIKFEAEDINFLGWNGIRINSSATNVVLNFCKIEDGIIEGVRIESDNVEISNCDIQNNFGNGIYIRSSHLIIRNSRIRQNALNGILYDHSQIDFFNVAITNNEEAGIYSTDADDEINLTNSIVADNAEMGVFCDNGILTILNSIIFNNQLSIDASGSVSATYSNIEYGGVYPGEGNIQTDPVFIADYALDDISPSIDMGNASNEYLEVYFPPSKGGMRNDMGIYGGPLAANWQEPPLQVTQAVFDFGAAGVGFTEIDTLIILNSIDNDISISTIEFSGADSVVFSVESFISNVAANDSALIEIGFSPTQERSFNAEITITHSMGRIKNKVIAEGLAPSISVSQSMFNFGSVLTGIDSVQQLTLYNNGNSDLIIYSDSLWIFGNPNFTFMEISQDIIVPVSDSATIDITFRPLAPGYTEATLHIITNDPDNNETLINLSGTGLFNENYFPVFSVSQSEIDFGEVYLNQDSLINLSIYNSGLEDLILYSDSINFLGPGAAFFSVDSFINNLVISSNDSVVLGIRFEPANTALSEAMLSIISNDPNNREVQIDLSGRGTFSDVFFPLINVSQSTIDFGEVYLSQDSLYNLTIYNNGLATLIVYSDSLSLSGIGTTFTIDTLLNDLVITSGDSAVLSIRFTPIDTGNTEATLHIISNDPDNNDVQINLIGSALAIPIPILSVSQTTIDFGEVNLGHDSLLNLIVYNNGLADLIVYSDSLNLSGPGATFFSIDSVLDNLLITAGDSAVLDIRFTPTDTAYTQATLNVISNDPNNREVQINLNGRGAFGDDYLPFFSISTSVINFGEVNLNQDSLFNIVINNTGLANLIIYSDSLAFSGSEAAFFSADSFLEDLVIAFADSGTITIKFSPTVKGYQQAALNIYHNDDQRNPQQVLLSGIGIRQVSVMVDVNEIVSDTEFISGEEGVLAFDILSDDTVDSSLIFIRKGGAQDYNKLSMLNQNANTWQGTINADFITERGLEYYLMICFADTQLNFPVNGEENPQIMEINVPTIEFPFQTKENIYQLISVPVLTNSQELTDIISDDLGSYNNTKYRVFDYSSGAYVELEDLNQPLPPGKALWLITKRPESIDIENAKSVPTNLNWDISLSAGWNMISNPYSFPVLWNDNVPNNLLRFYDGSDWIFSSIMDPYKGYLVWVDNDSVISIAPDEHINPAKTSEFVTDGNWYFQIMAKGKNYSDKYNYAGVKSSSSQQIDKYDQHEPPPIGNYLSLYFEIEDKEKRFSADFQQPGQKGYKFQLAIESNSPQIKEIEFAPFDLPNDFDWVVISRDMQLNYGKGNISINSNKRQFELLVGTPEFINEIVQTMKFIPANIDISQNYPNPFNPQTTINFQLDNPLNVQMEIYNILGQKVKVLIKNKLFAEGYHSVQWNGVNDKSEKVSSGIYFLRFKAGSYIKTLKMILKN